MLQHNFNRGAFVGAAAAALGTITVPVASQAAGAGKKTYVLVHGAWHGGWCWKQVADILRGAGHTVYTPTQTGLGDRAHLLTRDVGLETFVQDILGTFDMEDIKGAILVGHSFGGATASMVVDRIPASIRHLVLLDTGMQPPNENVFAVFSKELVAQRIQSAMESSAGLSLPVPPPSVFGVTSPDGVALLERHLRPHPFKTYTDTVTMKNPLGNGVPITYIACTDPVYPPLADTHALARKQSGWHYIELASGHDAMIIKPNELAKLLLAVE